MSKRGWKERSRRKSTAWSSSTVLCLCSAVQGRRESVPVSPVCQSQTHIVGGSGPAAQVAAPAASRGGISSVEIAREDDEEYYHQRCSEDAQSDEDEAVSASRVDDGKEEGRHE